MKMISEILSIIKFIVRHPLNSNNKLRQIVVFLRWQLGARALRNKVVVPWVEDSKFVVGLGDAGLTGNIYAGFMEYAEMLFLLHALRPTDTFVDVGANIGAYTVLAAKVVGSNTISFEPLPETAERLKDQVHINRITSLVDVRNIGIGSEAGVLRFTNSYDTMNKVALSDDDCGATPVNVSTLDVEVAESAKYFVKIDVEGFEYHVISGGCRLFSSEDVFAMIIELNGSGDEFGHGNDEIHQKLIGFNFVPVSYDPKTRTLEKCCDYNRNGGNTIYVKDMGMVAQRCISAPKRVVHTAGGVKI